MPARSAAEEERCAIPGPSSGAEDEVGVPRAWAEGFGRLDPNRPPASVSLRRWDHLIDDIGRFLDGPFCPLAIKLGWGPVDLFGCDRDQPFARIDQAGLLWLLHGDELVELTATLATIKTRTGERHTFRRNPGGPDRVLVWEIV
jgi:hypothetical protein